MIFTTNEVIVLIAFAVQWGYTMHRMNTLEKVVSKMITKMEIKTQ